MSILSGSRRNIIQQQLHHRQNGDQTLVQRTSIERRQATTSSSTLSSEDGSQSLSSAVKRQIGLAVGIPLGVILIISIMLYWLWRRNKGKQQEMNESQYFVRRKSQSKRKSKTGTRSSTRSVSDSMRLKESFPSPGTIKPKETNVDSVFDPVGSTSETNDSVAEPTALPLYVRKDSEIDEKALPSRHSIFGDIKSKVSLSGLAQKLPGSRYEEKLGIDRHPSNASSRGGVTSRPSQRELYYQNLHVAQGRGDFLGRSASSIPQHVLTDPLPRSSSPIVSSIRGDPEFPRPTTPGFPIATELARHDAHLQLLEERRAIAERYGQLIKEQDELGRTPTSNVRPTSTSPQYRTHTPMSSVDRGTSHSRTPSRQNLAQQAYQNQFYQKVPGSASTGHQLQRSRTLTQQQTRHGHQPSSGSLRRHVSAPPTPYSGRPDRNKPLPAIPLSESSHSRGQSNPTFQEREPLPGSHRRVKSHDQSSSGSAGRGSVRTALNELRDQGIEIRSPSARSIVRSSSVGGIGRKGSIGGQLPGLKE